MMKLEGMVTRLTFPFFLPFIFVTHLIWTTKKKGEMLVKLMTSESEKSHGSMMLRLVDGKIRVLNFTKTGLELLLLVLAP